MAGRINVSISICNVTELSTIAIFFALFPIEILQCSAVCENDVFNKYIVPFGGISEGASNINGLKKHKNQLKLNGNVLHDAFKTPKEGKKDNYFSETYTSLYFFLLTDLFFLKD